MSIVQIGYYAMFVLVFLGAFLLIAVFVPMCWKVQREEEEREDAYMRSILTPEQYENYLLRKEIRKAAFIISSSSNTSNSFKL